MEAQPYIRVRLCPPCRYTRLARPGVYLFAQHAMVVTSRFCTSRHPLLTSTKGYMSGPADCSARFEQVRRNHRYGKTGLDRHQIVTLPRDTCCVYQEGVNCNLEGWTAAPPIMPAVTSRLTVVACNDCGRRDRHTCHTTRLRPCCRPEE